MGIGIVVAEANNSTRRSEERCDFFRRKNTAEISKWRKEIAARLVDDHRSEPLTNGDFAFSFDHALLRLREAARILALVYDIPDALDSDSGDQALDADSRRVILRLDLFRYLQQRFTGRRETQRTTAILDLAPTNLRSAIRRSMSLHGRKVCLADRPLCDSCEIRNFCSKYRREQASRNEVLKIPQVVDLFAGAGGLSEGFMRAGFRTILAVDSDPVALSTFWLNHPAMGPRCVVKRDIREMKAGDLKRLTDGKQVDVLIGSPPCQGFSHAGFRAGKTRNGYRVANDHRNYLFETMISAASELQPKLFLLENVPGMQSARRENLSFIEHAARTLEDRGHYSTAIWRLNASAFGVPQDRIRYFLIASRIGTLPCRPDEEYQDAVRTGFDVDALPPITFEEAVFDLPHRDAGTGSAVEIWNRAQPPDDLRYRRFIGKFGLRNASCLIYNHTSRPHNERDLELYSMLHPGENSIHAIEKYGRDDLMRYRRDIFADKYSRIRGDKPCKTILSHLAKDGNGYIHPNQTRSITVREAARIQSFHDGYMFCGTVSQQWTQVGNAVPPLLAEAIARSFMQLLRKASDR